MTEGREVINPRPRRVGSLPGLARQAIGFISYSEGCNDDVNKIVWSGMGWDRIGPSSRSARVFPLFLRG